MDYKVNIGKTKSFLTVKDVFIDKEGSKNRTFYACECICGNSVRISMNDFNKISKPRSCGCKTHWNRIDGRKKHPLYFTYMHMLDRCTNPKNDHFKDYGGRGFKVCEAWRNDFHQFTSDVGERPEGLSLDRIDNNGDYKPENVRWATAKQQRGNQRPRKRIT